MQAGELRERVTLLTLSAQNGSYAYQPEKTVFAAAKASERGTILSSLGMGARAAEMLANVAASYANGEVQVIEHNDQYYFVVDFVGTKGKPPNLDDLKAAFEEIKPAHLGIQY